jgi:hypothetical protein
MPDRPDLLTQLERYGSVLEAEPQPEVDTEPGTVYLRPLRRPSPVRRRARTVLVAAAAVVVLLAGVLALSRARAELDTSRVGDDPPAVDPSGPALSPRLVAHQPPGGLVPTAAFEGGGAPGVEPSMSDSSAWMRPAQASTVQAFSLTRGDGAPVTMSLVITPTGGTYDDTNGPDERVRGVGALEGDWANSRNLSWYPGRTQIQAKVPDDVTMSELRAIVEALSARSDEVLAGFDAPASPVGAWTVALRAEHVVAWDTPVALPESHVWYQDPADARRVALLAGYGPVPGAAPELLGTMTGGERRTIAGAERVVDVSLTRDDLTTVTWLRPDGTQAVLTTRGLSDADIEALVAGTAPADPPTWDRVRADVGTTLRAGHVVAEADLPVGRVEIYGDENRAPRSLRGACLTVPGTVPHCTAIAPLEDRLGGGQAFGAQGPLPAASSDSGQYVTSLLVNGRWYGVGALPFLDALTVTADGSPVEAASARSTGNLTVFAAELPRTAMRAEISGGLGMQGPVATTPGEHLLGPFRVTLVRP